MQEGLGPRRDLLERPKRRPADGASSAAGRGAAGPFRPDPSPLWIDLLANRRGAVAMLPFDWKWV